MSVEIRKDDESGLIAIKSVFVWLLNGHVLRVDVCNFVTTGVTTTED